MKKALTTVSFALLVFALIFSPVTTQAQENARDLMNRSIKAVKDLKSATFKMKRKERFGDKYVQGEMDCKLNISPRKLYIFNHYPDKGSEVLWVEGKYGGKARVNPNRFPYVNVNLDPYGSLIMNNQHHSVHHLGFDYTRQIIEKSFEKYGSKFDEYVTYKGTETWDGRKCHVVEINFTAWKWENYTVKSGENLFDIGSRLIVSEQLIVDKNPKVSGFNDVKAGQVILVPNAFAKKSILYIDAQNYLPIVQEVHDEKGVFERYEYRNLKVNPSISPAEFTEDYDGYGF